MKNADTAMFHGKGQGKNTYQYFTSQMNIAVKRRMTLETALRRAVLAEELRAALPAADQPGDRRDHRGRGAGALADRGQRHGDAGRLHPARRRDRPHQRDRRMGAARGLPPGEGVAGPGARAYAAHGGQPVGAAVRRPRLPRHGHARARTRRGLDPAVPRARDHREPGDAPDRGHDPAAQQALRDGRAASPSTTSARAIRACRT